MANSTALDLMRAEVLSRLALGHSIRKIQRDLHIGYRKVIAIQSQHQATPSSSTRIAHITPLAYDAVQKTLTTNEWPQAGSLGMRWLENTELRDAGPQRVNIFEDKRLQVAIAALLPPLSPKDANGNWIRDAAPAPAIAAATVNVRVESAAPALTVDVAPQPTALPPHIPAKGSVVAALSDAERAEREADIREEERRRSSRRGYLNES